MKNKYSIFSLIKNAFSYHENWQKAWRDPILKKEYDIQCGTPWLINEATGKGFCGFREKDVVKK